LPEFISFSSGKSRYRSAGLGAAAGWTLSRMSVSVGVAAWSAEHGSVKVEIAVKARQNRRMESL
jgi:hypothetical protein